MESLGFSYRQLEQIPFERILDRKLCGHFFICSIVFALVLLRHFWMKLDIIFYYS